MIHMRKVAFGVVNPNHDTYDLDLIVTAASVPAFKELIQRGANLWPDAPPEIKEFADLITTGRILQDYRSQSKSRT